MTVHFFPRFNLLISANRSERFGVFIVVFLKGFIVKNWLLALPFLLSGVAQAAGSVDFLEVENDIVLFSTSESKVSPATCVTSENNELWSVSLNNETGRAIYSLVLTALAKGESVGLNVASAEDCSAKPGVERASKVNIVAHSSVPSSSGSARSIGVYKADGVTRVGTLANVTDRGAFQWVTDEASQQLKNYTVPSNYGIYFVSDDCSGPAYISRDQELVRNQHFQDGQYLKTVADRAFTRMNSFLNANGSCTANDNNIWAQELIPTEHPDCGANRCTFRED